MYSAIHSEGKATDLDNRPAEIARNFDGNGVMLTDMVNRHNLYFGKLPATQLALAD